MDVGEIPMNGSNHFYEACLRLGKLIGSTPASEGYQYQEYAHLILFKLNQTKYMSLEQQGKLIVKGDTQQVNERMRKREFVLEISEDVNGKSYTNYGKFQLMQNRCELLDKFNTGDTIKVSFNIKGNKWEKDGKVNYISNMDTWRL